MSTLESVRCDCGWHYEYDPSPELAREAAETSRRHHMLVHRDTSRPTEPRLDAIAARLAAITAPGPWKAYNRGIGYEVHGANDDPINEGCRETFYKGDAEFIAAAPADIEYLLAELKKRAGVRQ